MAKLADLKKYLNYEFSTGSYTGEDYKSLPDQVHQLLEGNVQGQSLALGESGQEPLLLFRIYSQRAKQVCVYLNIGCALFRQRMV